jgi:hypothetical protein
VVEILCIEPPAHRIANGSRKIVSTETAPRSKNPPYLVRESVQPGVLEEITCGYEVKGLRSKREAFRIRQNSTRSREGVPRSSKHVPIPVQANHRILSQNSGESIRKQARSAGQIQGRFASTRFELLKENMFPSEILRERVEVDRRIVVRRQPDEEIVNKSSIRKQRIRRARFQGHLRNPVGWGFKLPESVG